ncbi:MULTISPECIES: 1,4-alpha-glucan branching protein GlgB [Catenuloplanes]|uniref:1,4-alpha-glucan branching enzyme GlgB n=1 Tax=Catenuloplanes niger TaxID=587534 RepID=A0AAE4A1L7_9ACTN|nr:1,4-alpha-glucan branching protein GlgB [Catenuloplanes niger]MDR7327585.1 1,4-alpha-glucan branching enzyme [Catenuloplanes niger]
MTALSERLVTTLGARVTDAGVVFAVWAPHAREVRVVGDFTGWDPDDGLPMRQVAGVWEVLAPDAREGDRYRYRILGADGRRRDKADPFARHTEIPPRTASVVYRSSYTWGDDAWMARRARRDPHREPMSVYEVHLGSWRPGLGYRELADELVRYVRDTGFTHVEFLPVMEHPFGGSWGYQVTGYFAPTARFGSPDEFRTLVDALHRAGIGVLLDWVPAHFPRDDWALGRFDGTPLYEHAGTRGEHPDWGTYVFDHGRHEVRAFLIANALYWCEEFHADGLRVDAVASMLYLDYSRGPGEWLPNRYGGNHDLDAISLLRELTTAVRREWPDVLLVAEESTAFPGVTADVADGGLGFAFKWNMGWMHDTLTHLGREPERRGAHRHELTAPLSYAWSERYVLPISHDEVVHGKGSLTGKMPGDAGHRLAGTRALLAWMWAYPGKKLLFMGAELGDEREWSHERGLDWTLLDDPARAGLHRLVADLNAAYRGIPALWAQDGTPAGFRWIGDQDGGADVVAFARIAPDGGTLVCVANLSATPREHRVGLPAAGRWAEVLNTDAHAYGGSGVAGTGGPHTEHVPWNGLPVSAVLRVPPLGVLWLRPA